MPRDDPQRDCLIRHTRSASIHRYAENGQEPIILALCTWTLINIGDVGQEFSWYPQLLRQEHEVIFIGALDVHPAVGGKLFQLGYTRLEGEVALHYIA